MYTGYAFEHDWDTIILEINQKAFAENLMTQYGITAFSNIPASPGVDFDSRVEGGSGSNKRFQICVESSTTHGVLEYSTRVCTRLNILIA